MKLVSLFSGQEIELLDSVMPGGDKWAQHVKDENSDCLSFCPYFNKPCDAHGPHNLCSMGKRSGLWRGAPENMATLAVLLHVLTNFKHYDRGDFKGAVDSEEMIGRMTKRIESRLRKLANSSGKTEGEALTKVGMGKEP
ncbi:MAG: hypothetical protein PWP23_1096 [Candidatus Sumerlaeota bacterium]|nr:hypothetical protein [Candidatus Sumerlaeota bacterium]